MIIEMYYLHFIKKIIKKKGYIDIFLLIFGICQISAAPCGDVNSSGSGSFAAAVGASGKRPVVFEVGGVINLNGNRLIINNGQLTIAGQTAPAPGITLNRGTMIIRADNVVVSQISVRVGDGDGGEPDTIETNGRLKVLDSPPL